MQTILGLIVIAGLIALYFLPYIIASRNKHKNKEAIGLLNFFFGWTLIGWVGALIWAVAK